MNAENKSELGDLTPEQERELFHFLLENIPDRIYFKDAQSRFIRMSSAMAQFFGLASPAEATGKSDFDFFTREHAQPAFDDEKQIMSTGQPIVGKVEKETLPDGRLRWAITTKMPLRNRQGKIVGTCGVSKDFTPQKAMEDALAESNEKLAERQKELHAALDELNKAHEHLKAVQQQLVEAEKVQTAGRLAFGVAHEIRNPLNILHAGIDFFGNKPTTGADEASAAILHEMREAIRRADTVICALMDSSADANLRLKDHDIATVIEHVLTTLDADFTRCGIKVVKAFASDLPRVKLDANKFDQVLSGIFRNAIDAMSAGGELTVTTQVKELSATEIERNAGLRSGDRFRAGEAAVVIEIDDTGCGIPHDALPNIFDPFFTTKETGAAAGTGTGMGLTVARKIIQLHRGEMKVTNRPEGGVRVTIVLKV